MSLIKTFKKTQYLTCETSEKTDGTWDNSEPMKIQYRLADKVHVVGIDCEKTAVEYVVWLVGKDKKRK